MEPVFSVNMWFRFGQVTRHDIKDRKAMGKMSEAYPHLILDNFTTKVSNTRLLSHFVLSKSSVNVHQFIISCKQKIVSML